MVERRADGSLYPYVMDFGLAREVTAPGQTLGGTIEGTPAFMSPEQARGEIQGLDRRTDVYSLGATLYDLLAGAPPFSGESGAQILLTVLLDEPRPLRQRVQALPTDLETVVMKCLEKEPERRYDSAKALADELDRYLAGEPIAARQQSVGYRVWKFLRRHKVLAATITVATLCVLSVSALLVRTRLQTAAEARLGQQLGQEVKEIELFLRLAYTMPLHDVGREVARIRERMATLEHRLPALRRSEAALGHYALGRGRLALHEYDEARGQLEAALALGNQAPEVHAALGLVLGEQYRKQLAEAQRSGDKAWLKNRKDELERQYLEPARAHLLKGREATLESAAYAEGLLAFYSQHYAEALRKTAEAAQEAPWLYEVSKLEGDIHTAIAEVHKGHGEYELARAAFTRAATAYKSARDFARSDASVYEAEADMYIRQMELEKFQGFEVEQSLQHAITACDKAQVAAAGQTACQEKKVWAYYHLVDSQVMTGKDPRPSIKKITDELLKRVETRIGSVLFKNSIGEIFFMQAVYEQAHGFDYSQSLTTAEKYFREALAIDSKFVWAWNGVASIAGMDANRRGLRGLDYRQQAFLSVDYFLKAFAINNDDFSSLSTMLYLIYWLTQLDLEYGRNPADLLKIARNAENKILLSKKNDYQTTINSATCKIVAAQHSIFLGISEAPYLQTAHQQIDLAAQLQLNNPEASRIRAEADRVGALAAALRGEDPSAQIALGLTAASRSIALSPGEAATHQIVAQLYLLAVDWAAQHGGAVAVPLKQARSAAERVQSLDPLAAMSYLRLAEVEWREARALPPHSAAPAIAKGLAHVDQALAINPRLGRAFAARAALLAQQARIEPNPARRAPVEQAARDALRQALTLNRFLKRECTPLAATLGFTIDVDLSDSPAAVAPAL